MPVPIFDSATHPTLTGDWLQFIVSDEGRGRWESLQLDRVNSIESLQTEMRAQDVKWAVAMGMGGVGSYDEKTYASAIRASRDRDYEIFPIAFAPLGRFSEQISAPDWVARAINLGYSGVKIHPRIAGIGLDSPSVHQLMEAAGAAGLPVFICTYLAGHDLNPEVETSNLWNLLAEHRTTKTILVHGGLTRLLDFAVMVKTLPNATLDLSYTLCKFEGSSLDLDLRYLAKNFDQRICIGSDSPEFTLAQMRTRFEWLVHGLDDAKIANIAYKNLLGVFMEARALRD